MKTKMCDAIQRWSPKVRSSIAETTHPFFFFLNLAKCILYYSTLCGFNNKGSNVSSTCLIELFSIQPHMDKNTKQIQTRYFLFLHTHTHTQTKIKELKDTLTK
mmetsp:Transcript_17490/g.24991  ORF Transcript_17490/g.24991 Transcript_17490/m.24991 type:complete len:103 (+) Transcript_17490:3713-4021(+)